MALPPDEIVFRPQILLVELARRAVRYVIVGAYAAQMQQIAGVATTDVDIVPNLDGQNLQQLAEALHGMKATVRVENHGAGPVGLPADGGLIAKAPILNLHLPGVGDVDVIHRAATEMDYEALRPDAMTVRLPGSRRTVLVMSEDHWVESKRTPPVRAKDEAHLRAYDRWREGG